MDFEIIGEITNVETMNQNSLETQFAVCIKNEGYPASLEIRKIYQVIPDSLEIRKIYQVIPDPQAARHHFIRVVDESGEDYLYPEDYFILIDLPHRIVAVLSEAS